MVIGNMFLYYLWLCLRVGAVPLSIYYLCYFISIIFAIAFFYLLKYIVPMLIIPFALGNFTFIIKNTRKDGYDITMYIPEI